MANYICSSKRIVLDYILIFTHFFTHNSLYLFIFIFFNQSLGDKNTYKSLKSWTVKNVQMCCVKVLI